MGRAGGRVGVDAGAARDPHAGGAQRRDELLGRKQRGAVLDRGPTRVGETAIVGKAAELALDVRREREAGGDRAPQRIKRRLIADDCASDRLDAVRPQQIRDQPLHRGADARSVGAAVIAARAERRVARPLEVHRPMPGSAGVERSRRPHRGPQRRVRAEPSEGGRGRVDLLDRRREPPRVGARRVQRLSGRQIDDVGAGVAAGRLQRPRQGVLQGLERLGGGPLGADPGRSAQPPSPRESVALSVCNR